MSLSMLLTRSLLRLTPNRFRSAERIDAAIATRRPPAPLTRALRRRCEVSEETVLGVPVLTLTPRRGRPGAPELVYLHGGAYVFPLQKAHWWIIDRLIVLSGVTVTVPLYPRAPEHSLSEALPFLDSVMVDVRRRAAGREVFVAGDSAGAGLALAHTIVRRDRGGELPDGLLLFSPWLDATMSNPAVPRLERLDPTLAAAGLVHCAELWTRGGDIAGRLVSPLNDSLERLPPTFVYQGTHDVFAADARRFARKAEQLARRQPPPAQDARPAPSAVELRLYRGGFHDFVGATFTPESRRALGHAASVLARRGPVRPPAPEG
ncbi:alpha/beta hydrolase [Herbiconiux sp. VKM Ac-2851]|uniref:alpha/beta hydrolase n=1 Tax=Herbiconiux sp. VKM Ac-2851 TaxID=2739025 RepID=UPI00156740EB|nr:alpha/beta hydrolase [Herbiconiux sp. VKM Ac-2851]NQX36071.1 alpha/beta hydrolase [Herbiconiux sp. VKM Ac-2851]